MLSPMRRSICGESPASPPPPRSGSAARGRGAGEAQQREAQPQSACVYDSARMTKQIVDPARLTHFDAEGSAHMVDVGAKPATHRVAVASGRIVMQPATLRLIAAGAREEGRRARRRAHRRGPGGQARRRADPARAPDRPHARRRRLRARTRSVLGRASRRASNAAGRPASRWRRSPRPRWGCSRSTTW